MQWRVGKFQTHRKSHPAASCNAPEALIRVISVNFQHFSMGPSAKCSPSYLLFPIAIWKNFIFDRKFDFLHHWLSNLRSQAKFEKKKFSISNLRISCFIKLNVLIMNPMLFCCQNWVFIKIAIFFIFWHNHIQSSDVWHETQWRHHCQPSDFQWEGWRHPNYTAFKCGALKQIFECTIDSQSLWHLQRFLLILVCLRRCS